MGEPARKRATYQDVLDAPPHMVAEVIDGRLYLQSRPRSRHARSASRLTMQLGPFDLDGDGGWIILIEPELHVGSEPDILAPDLAGWRRARMPEMPDTPYFTLAPDWICEVLSPSTEDIDRVEKLSIYAREGVTHTWLIDPAVRTLEVFRLDGATYRLAGAWRAEAVVRAEPFDAIELPLTTLWAR